MLTIYVLDKAFKGIKVVYNSITKRVFLHLVLGQNILNVFFCCKMHNINTGLIFLMKLQLILYYLMIELLVALLYCMTIDNTSYEYLRLVLNKAKLGHKN